MIHYLLSKNVRTDLRNNAGLTALELGKPAAAVGDSSSSARMDADRRIVFAAGGGFCATVARRLNRRGRRNPISPSSA